MIGTSLTCLLLIESLRQPDGRIARGDDHQTAERLQVAQVATGGIALGLMVAGALHALNRFEPSTQLDERVIRPGGPARAPAGATLTLTW